MKILKIAGIAIAALILSIVIAATILFDKKSIQFLLTLTGTIKPTDYKEEEIKIKVDGEEIPMKVFTSTHSLKGKYYFFLHGFTPESYQHPALIKMAIAFSHATGRTVMIPFIRGSVEGGRKIPETAREVADIYMTLKKTYPGRYNAFGSCIAGTGLLISFNRLPVEDYPDKLFLYGPFFRGIDLINYYNQVGVEIDYMVKLANAMWSEKFNKKEKALISKAIIASKPGITDRKEMRRVLGDSLYERIDSEKVFHDAVIGLNETSIFIPGKKIPSSKFYIIHSASDNIVPFTAGLGLHKFLTGCGAKSRFLGTNIFTHTQVKLSPLQAIRETFELIEFLDDLLDEKSTR